jgi:hypothetical protein
LARSHQDELRKQGVFYRELGKWRGKFKVEQHGAIRE